jgi:hypothetical protein
MSDDEVPELPEKSNKKIALFITVLALMLALAELGAKSAQTEAIINTVSASDSWAFYQAKSIRQTTFRTAADALDASLAGQTSAPASEQAKKLVADWRSTADRYESDPAKGEGKKELAERAQGFEHHRDSAIEHYHVYEIAGVILQISVVLASTSVVTGIALFVWLASIGGVLGFALTLIGLLSPALIHPVLALLGGH